MNELVIPGGLFMALSYNNNTDYIVLPVLPERLEFKDSSSSQTHTVVGAVGHSQDAQDLGFNEASVYEGRALTEVSFSGFFTENRHLHHRPIPERLSPSEQVSKIQYWMGRREPKRFIFNYEPSMMNRFKINFACTIESFDWALVAGSDDVEYALTLKRYEFFAARKAEIKKADTSGQAASSDPVRMDDRERPESYTLVSGDNLWKVAAKWLGSGARWPEIMKLNGIRESDLRRLPIGLVVKLPRD